MRPKIAICSESTQPTAASSAAPPLIHSRLRCPISHLSSLRQSLLFAELSKLAYEDQVTAARALQSLRFDSVQLVESEGAQAYLMTSLTDVVIAFRGTEPDDWNDLRADINLFSIVAETVGRVHRGFKSEVDVLWPVLERALVSNDRTLWFAGHSLGGAMATICAGRCKLSHIPSSPAGLFTYGSPRVGNRRYIQHTRLHHLRWVNNNDIVTRIPPRWMGYSHCGTEVYVDTAGHIRSLNYHQQSRDRWKGLWHGLQRGTFDPLEDHRIDLYIEAIHRAVLADELHHPGDIEPDLRAA